MTKDIKTTPWPRQRPAAAVVGALTLAFGVSVLPAECDAAGPSRPLPAPVLRALLATNTNVLSENALAGQTGAGLNPPEIIGNEPNGSAKVLLWDEMRIAPLLNPPNDGVVTGGAGGR